MLLRTSRPSLEVFGTCPDIYHLIYINDNFSFRGSGRALVKATDLCTVEQVQAAVDRYVSTALSTG